MDRKSAIVMVLTGMSICVAACSGNNGGTTLSIESQGFECEGSSCSASFVVENLHDSDTELAYEIELYRAVGEHDNGGSVSVVGEAQGTIMVKSQERQVVTAQIDVTDEPNGMSAGYSTVN